MAIKRWGLVVASVATILAIALGYRWWASDERAIRHQMSAIAQSLTVPAHEGSLGAITRLGSLRKALASDIRVLASASSAAIPGVGAQPPDEIVGRDMVLALVGRWIPPPGGTTVEFVDVQLTVDAGQPTAQVYCTAKVTSRGTGEQPTVDARELTAGFAKVEGTWIVTWVRPEETLVR
jgi:hypothetical protein